MASHTRRRTNSNAATLPFRGGQDSRAQSKATSIKPKSDHTSDEFLREFLNPSFDPAAYLNATLPLLAIKQASTHPAPGAMPLAELSAQTQTLLSQINAHTTRLSTTLTQLTDGILRSGSRLAYEVELLRGETLNLSETLHETLRDDIEKFVPGGLQPDGESIRKDSIAKGEDVIKDDIATTADTLAGGAIDPADPEYVKQLQTLTLVRARLESVIKTFGDAMEFTFPPSEISVTSSFLSVSAPEPGSEQQSSEEKGQIVLKRLRDEISDLLHKADDSVEGIEKAAARIEELKELTVVWKDTAEEKGRGKFIETLAKMVEDRHRDLMREMEQANKRGGRLRSGSQGSRAQMDVVEDDAKAGPGGFGLISQLQKLRSGL